MKDEGNIVDFPRLKDYKVLAIDIEATGVTWYRDELFGFSVSTEDFDIYHDIRKEPSALDWLHDELKHFDGIIVNHNIKFDAHFLRQEGINLDRKKLRCTLNYAKLIDETRFENEYSLDSICHDWLGERKIDPYEELAALFGGKPTRSVQMKNLWKAPEHIVAPYARMDTALAFKLYNWQLKEIEEQNLHQVCSLEDDVLPILLRMEARGIKVDVAKAEENMEVLAAKIKIAQDDIDDYMGKPFNINSTPQIRELFKPEAIEGTKQFKLCDGTLASATKTGNPSINGEVLKQMHHPMAKRIINLRTMIKMHGTFLRDQILGFNQNGYIYPNFKQCGTVNGRFSASKPALQAIPKRNKEMSALTRSVFLPDDEEELLRCDFEQSDFRGFVHYTGSAPLIAAYKKDPWTDFHRLVATLLNIPRDCPPGGGVYAKPINLGSIFGMGVGKLAKTMGLPYAERVSSRGKVWLEPGPEAEAIFDKYHENIPGVEKFNKQAAARARSRGYVISIYGRHLRFPNKNFVYKAPGYLYSSFTSDLCKRAMVVTDELAKIKLQVHDEIIFSIPDRKVIPEIKEAMENALGDLTSIPIRTNPQIGPNWFDCKALEN